MKKSKYFQRSIGCLFLLIFMYNLAQAQREETRFMTHKDWDHILSKKPKDKKKWQDFELFAYMYARYAKPEEKTLPVVINVIETGGKTKITDELIYSQISVLNKAFAGEYKAESARMYAETVNGDTHIKFCMGTPQGGKPGINKISKATTYTLNDIADISSKSSGIEGAKKDEYINIWITDMPAL
jgi:hypothetical protein